MNSVNLIGNVTRDPQVKYTPGGTAVCELGLAINERKKQGEEWVDAPVFVDVTLFGKTAEIAGEYVQKGKKVGITGKLSLDQWKVKETGANRSKLKVTGDRLDLLATRGSEDQRPASANYGEEPHAAPVNHDDVPF